VVTIKRTKHSEKPEAFRAMIDKMYPNGRRIELFARVAANGWDRWGNQAGFQEIGYKTIATVVERVNAAGGAA